jgi:hypothetical protein
MAQATFARVAPPKRVQYAWGPVTRQRDRVVSLNTAQEAALSLLNVWLKDADTQYPMVEGRPGFYIADETMGATAAVQWVGQLSQSDGTEVSVAVAGGEIWTYTWATNTIAKVVTTANLTTASVTLDATARVYACEFADTLVFNDGTNRPFTWDGTSGAGGLTSLTNAPAVCYGAPWVHYGKLWFIKNAERSTVVWSEEGVANTGYEAGGYTNAWTLRQTATDEFYAGASTNDGLWLFRGNSITKIMGEVTPNFSTTGNDEAIEQVGCRSPSGVFNLNGALFFLSADRRIMRLGGDGQPVDVGIGARTRMSSLNAAQMARAFVELVDFQEQGERIIVGIPATGSDDVNAYVIVNPASGLCEGTWTGWKSTALGRWKNESGEWRLVHGGGDAATTVDDGLVYIHDVPGGSTWNDEFATPVPVSHQVETSFIGSDVDVEKGFVEGTALFQTVTGLTGVSVTVKTPRGQHALTTALTAASTGGAQWNIAIWNVDEWADETEGEFRTPFATRGVQGRWARLVFTHSVLDERFGLSEVTLDAVVTQRRPTVR